MSSASYDRELAQLDKRRQTVKDKITNEKQNHEKKMKDWSDKLAEFDMLEQGLRQRHGEQSQQPTNGNMQHSQVPVQQSQQPNASLSINDAEDNDDGNEDSPSSKGPPGFSDSVKAPSTRTKAPQNSNTPLPSGRTPHSASHAGSQRYSDHSPTPMPTSSAQVPRSVFNRLGQTPPQPASNGFDHPPGFMTAGSSTTHPSAHNFDLPPGFVTPGSSSAQQPNQRSGMRSSQYPYSAKSQDSASRSANQAYPSSGQLPATDGPPGFAGVPVYLAHRLSPSPAQKPSGLSNQPTSTNSRAAPSSAQNQIGPAAAGDDASEDAPPGFARAGNVSSSAAPAGQFKDKGSSGSPQDRSVHAHADLPPGYGPSPQASSQGDAPGYGGQPAEPTLANGWNGSSNGAHAGSSSRDVHEQGADEFPGLAFGIKDLDQRQKYPSADSNQHFPSLGGPSGSTAGSQLAGAWGKGAGQLAGSLRQQHQVSSVASSLAAAVQPPQPPTVHIERVELDNNLRVPGDDASDSIRKKRSKKREFEKWERVKGMGSVNIVEGLELHENVLSPEEQINMICIIEDWVIQGKQGRLKGRTFSAPRKWARGKGRITCQFGCCYNYAIDSEGRRPGIVAEEVVEQMPPVLVSLCKRLVRWGIVPKHKEPDTAIVNVYDVEDCIPPHIDHHDFDRPFCTISLQSQQNIMFGSKIISRGPGDFVCDYELSLPTGSCLVLKGNGADIAQHCVPPVGARRMSITLRRMQDVHARRVVAMAERLHAGLPVDTDNPPSLPQRLTGDDAYDMDERKEASYGSKRR